MKFRTELPSVETLNALLAYDPVTGSLTWRTRSMEHCSDSRMMKKFNTWKSGMPAGSELFCKSGKRSKIQIYLLGKVVAAHRVIWKMVHGNLSSSCFIDHINGNPFDNKLSNLRLSDDKTNQFNTLRNAINSHGVKGVTWNKALRKWKTQICAHPERVFLGYHATKGLAAVAYAKASLRYHGKFSPYYRSAA